ncbi:MAG: diaminopimelate decarboxylase [Lachnospiraceae bacterium]|nr:diaminopimelate decarboxylase [Lachnospiraceae bacterium]
MICNNITVENGILYFAGQDTTKLAAQYGTPLYLMDEDKIREKCRAYKHAFEKHFGPSAQPLYASKACCFKRIYEIMREEGMGIDVVSSGEIYTALKAGFDLSQAYFHSNNKTDEDIRFAIENGIGYFVADNEEEVKAVEAEAARKGIRQKLLLRLTPGIDPHTYEAVATGKVDSKFGTAIETGQAAEIVKFTLEQPHVELMGFHCHVGSQVFEEDIFERAAVVMLEFIAEMKEKLGFTAPMLDLGGGYGVRYVDTDPYLDIETKVADVAAAIKEACARLGIDVPEIHMEPGRSIVADAGMTLYTVGTVKKYLYFLIRYVIMI